MRTPKFGLRLAALVSAGLFVAACVAVAPTLKTTPTLTAFSAERQPIEVAILLPEAARNFTQAREIPGTCIGAVTFTPVNYGQNLAMTLEDRFRRQFDKVSIIDQAADRNRFDAVFEIGISDVGFQFGCLMAPQQHALVTGSLRAIDADGAEMWRSPTTQGRHDAPMSMGMDFNGIIGSDISQAQGKLADAWAREVGGMDIAQYASGGSKAAKMARRMTRRDGTRKRGFARASLRIEYGEAAERPDDIAVIIGNGDYEQFGGDIPDVVPAYADTEAFTQYVIEALGVREGNIIFMRDATGSQMTRVFGSETDHQGQLFDWVKAGRSRVTVYYSGHGAPGTDGTAYLVPADADASRIELNGYPLSRLYRNLAKLPSAGTTVVLEACFSGASQSGSVVSKASGIYIQPKVPEVPGNLTVIAAGQSDQVASWEEDSSNGLFTKYYLTGMSGAADQAPYGNGDNVIGYDELNAYLSDTLTYYARRLYGRDQQAQIVAGGRAMF
jgi:caspase domain-containing protein